MKPKAPTRQGNILGQRKQLEISTYAKRISVFGYEIWRFHIQTKKAMKTRPNVHCASFVVGVIMLIEVSHQLSTVVPSKHNLGFFVSLSALTTVCGVVLAYGEPMMRKRRKDVT